MSAETRLAWAAGFFDGEGCVPRLTRKNRDGAVRSISPRLTITQATDPGTTGIPESLLRFQEAVGVKCNITGPRKGAGNRPQYVLAINRYADVVIARDLLWPYLGIIKRAAFTYAFDAHQTVREDSLVHHKKVVCKRGHELTDDNVYIWSRKTGPDAGKPYRACKACVRLKDSQRTDGHGRTRPVSSGLPADAGIAG